MNAISYRSPQDVGCEPRILLSPGREVDVLRLDADDVEAHDLAHALAWQPFHAGLTQGFYSRAQHAIELARRVAPRHRLAALLRHAPAAYMGDMTRIRDLFPELRVFELRVQRAIHRRFGLVETLPPDVLEALEMAEATVVAIEEADLFLPTAEAEEGPPRVGAPEIKPLSPDRAERAYRAFLEIEAR